MKLRRLELGSGMDPLEGYEHHDLRSLGGINHVFDLTSAPWQFEADSFDEIKAIHVIEHISFSSVVCVFQEVRRILTPGGFFQVHVPDGQIACNSFLKSDCETKKKVLMLFYGQEAETFITAQYAHKVLYDESLLNYVFYKAGFVGIKNVTEEYEDRHDVGWRWLSNKVSLKMRGFKDFV